MSKSKKSKKNHKKNVQEESDEEVEGERSLVKSLGGAPSKALCIKEVNANMKRLHYDDESRTYAAREKEYKRIRKACGRILGNYKSELWSELSGRRRDKYLLDGQKKGMIVNSYNL
jgi:hypothetical protein